MRESCWKCVVADFRDWPERTHGRSSQSVHHARSLVELERDRNKARSRYWPQPLRFKAVTIGALIREGKLLEVHCGNCRPERQLYLNPEILRLSKRMPVPEVAAIWSARSAALGTARPRTQSGRGPMPGRRRRALSGFRWKEDVMVVSSERPSDPCLGRSLEQTNGHILDSAVTDERWDLWGLLSIFSMAM